MEGVGMICRVCDQTLGPPLLRYENMPSVAQYLPSTDSLGGDKGVTLEVCQCPGCGLVQLTSEPVPYYREVVRAVAFSEEMGNFRRKQFGDFIQRYSLSGKTIIEIGCGCGEYLFLMQGVEAYGLEYSRRSVAQCVKEGLRVEEGFMDYAYKLNHAPFDAFFMLNFLEHLPDPNSMLRGIHCNLVNGAIGLVEVPNFDMILRHGLFSEFMRDHLLYFTKETLGTTLALSGFEVIDCSEIWYDYIISAVVRKRAILDISRFHEHRVYLKDQVRGYIRQFGRVAVWGAGHQALAMISLMNLAGKIKYVVDSATFKQGKCTSATHIPIVSPEVLNSDPVEAIIIMAAGYSDEVMRIIRQKFDGNINIAILRDTELEIQ